MIITFTIFPKYYNQGMAYLIKKGSKMSSFNINGPSNNQPLVQSSQNLGKDGGGGGNTGYMNMRKKKGNNENSEDDNSVFLEETPEDSFVKSTETK